MTVQSLHEGKEVEPSQQKNSKNTTNFKTRLCWQIPESEGGTGGKRMINAYVE